MLLEVKDRMMLNKFLGASRILGAENYGFQAYSLANRKRPKRISLAYLVADGNSLI
jgi:hypothetical protein